MHMLPLNSDSSSATICHTTPVPAATGLRPALGSGDGGRNRAPG